MSLSGGVYRAYVYGPGGGQLIAMQSYDSGFYWLHTDHLGSGRKITNSSGNGCVSRRIRAARTGALRMALERADLSEQPKVYWL